MSEAAEEHNMMSFREMLAESNNGKRNAHPNGTYIALIPDKKTITSLAAWSKAHQIPNPIDPKELHTTLIYSRQGVPDAVNYNINLPLTVRVIGFDIFDSGDKKCLVALLSSEELERHHLAIRTKYGATHDYDEYHPHITLTYDYTSKSKPKDIPEFPIVLTSRRFEKLDTEWSA